MVSSRHIKTRLKRSLSSELTLLLEEAINQAHQLGLSLYLVGGAVRDLLMGRPINDLDLVVEGDAAILGRSITDTIGGEVTARSEFGTVQLRIFGRRIDVVTARLERYGRPGALPEVYPSKINDDLARRDFTINSMALRLEPGPLEVLNSENGQMDIERKLIHVLHAASFQDDATRILRAIRYEQRLGFILSDKTEKLLRRDIHMIDTIGGDRLRRELVHIFMEEEAASMLLRAAELGVLAALCPVFPDYVTIQHRLEKLCRGEGQVRPCQYLALLAYSLDNDQGASLIDRFKMPPAWKKIVQDVNLVRIACLSLGVGVSPGVVFRQLNQLNPDVIHVVMSIEDDVSITDNLRCYLTKWRHVRPILNGHDLVTLGMLPGAQIGQMLEVLRNARLDGSVVTKGDEEALVQKCITEIN